MTFRESLGSTFDPIAGSAILSRRLPMTLQCAWCPVVIREGGPQVSHGICPDCLAALTERGRETGRQTTSPRADSGTDALPVSSRSVSVARRVTG